MPARSRARRNRLLAQLFDQATKRAAGTDRGLGESLGRAGRHGEGEAEGDQKPPQQALGLFLGCDDLVEAGVLVRPVGAQVGVGAELLERRLG